MLEDHRYFFTFQLGIITENAPVVAAGVNTAAGGEPLSWSGGSPPPSHSSQSFGIKLSKLPFPPSILAFHVAFRCLAFVLIKVTCSTQIYIWLCQNVRWVPTRLLGSAGLAGGAVQMENKVPILLPSTPVPVGGHVPQKYVEAMNFDKLVFFQGVVF